MIKSVSDAYNISFTLDGTALGEMIEIKSPRAYLWKLDAAWTSGMLPQSISRK